MLFQFELNGLSPLLLHADDVLAADELIEWRSDPKNKGISVPGDDRSPAWTWHTYIYHDGTHLAIPSDNVMVSLRTGGTKIAHKRGSTFKAMSQSGLLIAEEHCLLAIAGKQVPLTDILKLRDLTFAEQSARIKAMDLDMKLFVKRAKVGTSKHVRVRLRLEDWSLSGTVEVLEAAITEPILVQMFSMAGRYGGLCDWRPSSPKSPGSYGMFESKLTAVKAKTKVA